MMRTLWKVFAVWAALGFLVMPYTIWNALDLGHSATRIATQVASPFFTLSLALLFRWLANRRPSTRRSVANGPVRGGLVGLVFLLGFAFGPQPASAQLDQSEGDDDGCSLRDMWNAWHGTISGVIDLFDEWVNGETQTTDALSDCLNPFVRHDDGSASVLVPFSPRGPWGAVPLPPPPPPPPPSIPAPTQPPPPKPKKNGNGS